MRTPLLLLLASAALTGCQSGQTATRFEYTSVADIQWGDLNPARGDQSPRAADLWGDRTQDTATGFLVKFKDGFSSPPHIHNVTYRGVVIDGNVHNDVPSAELLWMPPGSYWVQPAGGNHITAARGESNLAYIEIDHGPYHVQPPEQAHDSPDRAINITPSDLAWTDRSDGVQTVSLRDGANGNGPKAAFLKLPSGFSGTLRTHGASFRAVVIEGELSVPKALEADTAVLRPGSYFGTKGTSEIQIDVHAGASCTLYVRAEGHYELNSP